MVNSGSLIWLRVGVVDPLVKVVYALQRRNGDLVAPVKKTPDALWFETALRVGSALANGQLNFLGDSACGPPSDRFLYINSGQRAGQISKSGSSRQAQTRVASSDTG